MIGNRAIVDTLTTRHVTELLYDSEAILRLVDAAIEDLGNGRLPALTALAGSAGTADIDDVRALSTPGPIRLQQMLQRGYGEIVSVLGTLRASRSVLAREAARAVEHAHEQPRHVTATSEQLSYASEVLTVMEARLAALAVMLDPMSSQGDGSR